MTLTINSNIGGHKSLKPFQALKLLEFVPIVFTHSFLVYHMTYCLHHMISLDPILQGIVKCVGGEIKML